MRSLALVGPGHVGRTLAGLLSPHRFRIGPVLSRDLSAARRAVRELRVGWPTAEYEDLVQSDWIVVAVPEAQTASVLERIATTTSRLDRRVVLSTSGLGHPEGFGGLHSWGASTGVLYPLQVFQRTKLSLGGVHFIISGDPRALFAARSLVQAVGGQTFKVPLEKLNQAVVATSIATDGLTGLLHLATERMRAAGLPRKSALEALHTIVEQSFSDYVRSGRRTRPGPSLRGGAAAVNRLSEICRKHDPKAAVLYLSAMRQTLDAIGSRTDEFAFLRDAQGSKCDPSRIAPLRNV